MSTTPVIVNRDETAGCNKNYYHYARVVETCGRIVRARVTRDCYLQQCSAAAEVLADNMTWTHLVSEAPANWVDDTPRPSPVVHVATELGPLVDQLIRRAAEILAPPTTGAQNQHS